MVHLVTGYAGYAHIKSADDGAFNASCFGAGQYVIESGNQFAGSIIDNNTVRILDGDGLMYGRHFRIESNAYEDLAISTGVAGTSRIDLICVTYEKNTDDGTEKAFLQVIKGVETAGSAEVPEYTNGNILDGATFNQMPLYKAIIDGVVLLRLESMFETMPSHKMHISNKTNPHNVTANQIGLGNVENKSSETIRGELTKANVTDALGYTPPTVNTTYGVATQSANGLLSASDKKKLDGIASGAQVNTVTGIKGNAESSYRTGNVNLTPANIGALPLSGGTITGNLTAQGHVYMSYNKKILWSNNGMIWGSAAQQMFLAASTDTNYVLHFGVHDSTWALDPDVSGKLDMGTSNHKWNHVYANTGTIQTSDRNLKDNIKPLTDQHIKFFLKLAPVSFQFVDGTSGRTHVGFVSQDVEQAMADCGLTDLDFAGFCKDQKTVSVEKTVEVEQTVMVEKVVNVARSDDKTGEVVYEEQTLYEPQTITVEETVREDVPVEGEYVYSLRYEEFIALNVAVTQYNYNKILTLEEKLNQLMKG